MDPRTASSGDGPPPPPAARNELRGPRPAPLSVSKESHKIRKRPPLAPNLQLAHAPPPPPPSLPQPMIIYTLSPKVIHTTADDFMLVVQRLTGWSSSSDASSGGAVSPAARLAAIERTSPSERERERERAGDLVGLAGEAGVEMGRNPGILSPSPAILPAISPSIFSPATDPNNFSLLNDLSPFLSWNNSFLAHPSPSSLFSNPLVSPAPSPDLFFNQFLDF